MPREVSKKVSAGSKYSEMESDPRNEKYPKSRSLAEVEDNNKIEIACENANIDRGIITENSKYL